MNYQPRPEETQSILIDILRAPEQFAPVGQFAHCDAELITQVLGGAGKFVGEVVAPLSAVGDAAGCQFEQGRVSTPPGFKQAYEAFWQAGWPALACAEEDGGQALPAVLEGVLYEWLSAANHGWTMAPGLLHGAYECIKHHASAQLQSRYLAKIASGEWLATMCLTEAQAGSDLGLVRTRALPCADGSHALSGTKIFISGGEHDLTDNIVHLVLARLPDAPAGPKGLSLFLAPKFLPSGDRNAVVCERIEEKMGLHGSPTCVMRFDGASAWLVGEAGRGLQAMFVMMNSARLHVAQQGIGLLDAAWQKASAYSRERRQMRAPVRAHPEQAADLIAEHPAIQRVLETQRAWVLGARLLACQTGIELDMARLHPQAERRAAAQRWCSLLTPVLKSACAEQAFHGASACLQVFGGHGYVREWGIEQIVRDSRIAMIYEGTNEIQAIDLLVRKVLADKGMEMNALMQTLVSELNPTTPGHQTLVQRLQRLHKVTSSLVEVCPDKPDLAYWIAGDYLRAVALVMLDWAWTRIGTRPIANEDSSGPARAWQRWVMPELNMRLAIIEAALAHD